MLVLQAIPNGDIDAYKALRARIREANTWSWGNKAKTRLKHVARPAGGFVQISNANGVLVAHIHPKSPADLFYLLEKFTDGYREGKEGELLAINIQFVADPPPRRKKRKR